MKYYIDGIIVVEGKEDESYLSSFIDSYYIKTNGYDIPKEDIDFLKEAGKHTSIYVLTDPDKAGREIENKIKSTLPKAIYINIDIRKCTRARKDGIAECEKEEIIDKLNPYFKEKQKIDNDITYPLFYPLDKKVREHLSQKYHLGKCNNKQLIKRINILEISKEEVQNTIKEFIDDHQ